MHSRTPLWLALLGACASAPDPAPSAERASPFDQKIANLTPTKVLPVTDAQRRIDAAIEQWFAVHHSARGYVMVDKPIYQPGETIWFRGFLRTTSTLMPAAPQQAVTVRLVSPRGAIVAEKRVLASALQNDFVLPPEIEGGEYRLVLADDQGHEQSRSVIVATYEAPRLKKQLELLKKAYGAGDTVTASLSIAHATGEPFAGKDATAVVILDGNEIKRLPLRTDAQGRATVRFALPAEVGRGDGLLSVLADDGGMVESIQRRIPILTGALDFQAFAEGGDLVLGLPGRVYFAARNTIGKPADVEGRIVDDTGVEVATFKSVEHGMGRFELTPLPGKTYRAEITRPVGVTQTFTLPVSATEGCVLRTAPERKDGLAMAVVCKHPQTVTLEAVVREKRIAAASIDVERGAPSLVVLPIDPSLQGAVRVTVFDQSARPLAERLVYRGLGRDLRVSITPDRKTYAPRDKVTLTVRTEDFAGRPVPASVALSVVDDTVLSFADDKTAHILARLYLEPELGAQPIEEPNLYFAGTPEASVAMDLLMGTRGWRRFEWAPVLAPPPPVPSTVTPSPVAEAEAGPPQAAPPPPPPPAKQQVAARPPMGAADIRKAPVMKEEKAKGKAVGGLARARRLDRDDLAADEVIAGERMQQEQWAVVRQFPAPVYDPGYDGPRTDFRETIFWAPEVKTGADGTTKISFHVSDAVTSFRATAEGLSDGGLPGRGDAIVQSKMPIAVDVRFPLEVSAGDRIELPVSVTNETPVPVEGKVTITLGKSLGGGTHELRLSLAAGGKKTFYHPIDVVGSVGEGDVTVAVDTAGLRDEMKKAIRIVPAGFPFERSAAGTAETGKTARHTVELGGALPGTISAEVTLYPSPVATMTQGAKGLIREPGGCFEQTSSSNYPNVMVLRYLQSSDAADPELVEQTQKVLAKGYKILAGYETKQKGYEWFGNTPAHEALSAYGLMEFEDMKAVHEVDPEMVQRTATWLLSRRDGKGGFQRSAQALDSFGRASEAVTNGYIVWALTEAKRGKDLARELTAQREIGMSSNDPYLVGLAANSLLNVGSADASAVIARLVKLQGKDGKFGGAKETITMSGDAGRDVEATSLAVLALVKASPKGEHDVATRAAVDWLNQNRGGWGEWSSTQGTIMSLKALTAYAEHARQISTSGAATLVVNGRDVGTLRFDRGHKGALVWHDVAAALRPGANQIELRLDTQETTRLPYSIAISYRAKAPDTSAAAKIDVTSTWAKRSVKVGESVRVTARIVNKTAEGVPMTLLRIGVPGGLTFQTWQLKELMDKGLVDFYETRPREVILYFRALPPNATKEIALDLQARIPGRYEAPASQAYLYYTPEHRTWVAPALIEIQGQALP